MRQISLIFLFIIFLSSCDYTLYNPFINITNSNYNDSLKVSGDLRITNNEYDSNQPSLIWTGSGYGVTWSDSRAGSTEIYFTRVDASGNKIDDDIRITNASSGSNYSSLVWIGTEYGIVWSDTRDGNPEIYFTRIDASGNKIGSDVRITNSTSTSNGPTLVWTGTEYGVCWVDNRDGNAEIYFTRISSIGLEATDDIRITNNTYSSNAPSLIWAGTEYGIAWSDTRDDNPEIYFARINASGVKQGSDIRITNESSTSIYPSLEWSGTEYGVCWQDFRYGDGNYKNYFARINASGVKQGSDIRVSDDISVCSYPLLVKVISGYGISWTDQRDGDNELYFARIDASGNKIGTDIRITNNTASSDNVSLVWTGTEYGVCWDDDRDGNTEIYFARLNSSGGKL